MWGRQWHFNYWISFAEKYTMHFNNTDNKFKSIAYGLSNDAKILAKEDFNGISVWKQHFSNNLFSIVLIYSYPNTQTLTLIYCLNYVVGSGIDVLLWDFTVDTLDEVAYRRLKDTLIWKC